MKIEKTSDYSLVLRANGGEWEVFYQAEISGRRKWIARNLNNCYHVSDPLSKADALAFVKRELKGK